MSSLLVSHATGYHIHDCSLVVALAILIGLIPFVGYAILWLKLPMLARVSAWSLTAGSVFAVERLSADEPSGTRMLLIIVALLWSMKSVVTVESLGHKEPFSFKNWLAFVALWFGMRPKLFASLSNQPRRGWMNHVTQGLLRMALGVALIAAAYAVAHATGEASISPWRRWPATVCLLLGLSLVVHFGLFRILVGFWRRCSVNCTPLFRAPLFSQSLTEFWGRRWNLAFSEMTAIAVFRPLRNWLGKSKIASAFATASAFLFSGLLHELAISVPVGAGYGFPILYFILHGVGMLIENALKRSGIETLQRPWIGRTWTWSWIVLPLPILFHRPFLEGCVWPLICI